MRSRHRTCSRSEVSSLLAAPRVIVETLRVPAGEEQTKNQSGSKWLESDLKDMICKMLSFLLG